MNMLMRTFSLTPMLSCLFLSQAAFATANTTSTAAPVSDAERARIENIVHDYLVKKPEVLIEAMQTLQKREIEQTQNMIKETEKNAGRYAKDLFQANGDPINGNANGSITVVEFFDYQRPHCVAMSPIIDNIIKNNSNVRIVYKELPIRGPLSELAARAALAANMQGKYLALHHAIMTSHQPLSETVIFDYAKKAGINVDKLKKDMQSDAVNKQLAANMKLREELNLPGTPAFFIGKTTASVTDKIQYVPGRLNENELSK